MHTMTHRWWGSLSFIAKWHRDANGAAYITPDPFIAYLRARLRVMGIPTGHLRAPVALAHHSDPFEVFDGAAIGNSAHSNMDAKLHDYSEGAQTAGQYDGNIW